MKCQEEEQGLGFQFEKAFHYFLYLHEDKKNLFHISLVRIEFVSHKVEEGIMNGILLSSLLQAGD